MVTDMAVVSNASVPIAMKRRRTYTGVIEDGSTLCEDGIDNNCDGVDSACVVDDKDGDGFTPETGDCDENDPTVNPGRAETPYNHKDDGCDPTTPDGDLDGDGWSSERTYSREERLACRAACRALSPTAYAECVADPMAIFDPDQSPEDLAQRIEEYCAQRVEREEISCTQTCRPDCDDMNPNLNPGAEEIPRNGVDENCDGLDRLRSDIDTDMDGFTEQMGDCGEGDPRINPSANEIPYNGRDDDCNLATLDDDLDEDGYGVADDCDDTDPTINPGIKEAYYNGIDDDCNPLTDDRDADGDGFIASEMDGDDCNDRVASVRPRAPEIPYNGIDDDCNRETPDDDIDEDGVPLAEDCDDNNRLISPNAIENARENCSDGIDHDCKAGMSFAMSLPQMTMETVFPTTLTVSR